jgi:DHA1 family bicyclomycin/chloramphenicol resistance-like MFS transporter
MGMGALASVGVSLFNSHSALPTVSIMAATSLLALGMLLVGRQRVRELVLGEIVGVGP